MGISRILTSPKTIITLILLTLFASLTGFFVPQASEKSPEFFELWRQKNIYTYRLITRLQLHRVYTSYWFLTLVVMIALSLLLSIKEQFKKNLRIKTVRRIDDIVLRSVFSDIISTLKRRGYKIIHADDKRALFSKNHIGRWGSIIFHSGLLMIVISGIIVLCFQKRGFVQMMEEETFNGREEEFLVLQKGVLADRFDTGFMTTLKRFTHTYWDNGKPRFIESSIRINIDGRFIDKDISINHPAFIKGTRIYQSTDYGYTISLALRHPSGSQTIAHLNLDKPSRLGAFAKGRTDFPKSPYILDMKFLPDASGETFYLKRPILYLKVFKQDDILFDGLIVPGDGVKIGRDTLYFVGTRYWSGIIFVKNPGMFLAYLGIAIGIMGAIIMFLMPYREIQIVLDENQRPNITGMTTRYRAMFREELNEIKREVGIL